MCRRVGLVKSDVSEERITYILEKKIISELESSQEPRGVTFQKTTGGIRVQELDSVLEELEFKS
jgi:hypothetical protein